MMKSTWKKTMCIGLTALALAGTMSAAKKKGNDPYKKIPKAKDPVTKKVYDFGGMEVIVGDWWSNPDAPAAGKADEDQRAFRQWTCDTYNVKVVQKAVAGWGSHPQFVSNFCITGGDENYVMFIDGRSANTGVKAGLFYDLSKIKSVDYKDASKYDQGVVEKLKKGDSFYAFNWGKPEPKQGVFFNKRILAENGYDPDLPYDLQASGEWTWAKFEEILASLTKDTDNDGVIDQYGMSSFNTEFCSIALASNGGSWVGRDANGKYFNNAGSEKSMETLNWVYAVSSKYQLPQPEGANWDYFKSAFLNGETAFYVDEEYNAQPNGLLAPMADDWGFVCFPLGPSGDGKYKTLHNSNMVIIPGFYDDARAEKIAKAVDLWLEPVPGYDDPDSWKEGYYAGFRDSRAVDETLVLMAETPNPRFDSLISGLNIGDIAWSVFGGWATPQEQYESSKNVWQSLIDDCNR